MEIYLVFDIDDTIATAFEGRKFSDLIKPYPWLVWFKHNNLYFELEIEGKIYPHFIHPGVIEFFQLINQTLPNAKIAIFSSSRKERIELFIEKLSEMTKIKVERFCSASDLTFSDQVSDKAQYLNYGLPAGQKKKDLKKIGLNDEELKQTILIEDEKTFCHYGQEKNLLRIWDASADSFNMTWSDSFSRVNHIFFCVELLFSAIEQARKKRISLTEMLFSLQFIENQNPAKPFKMVLNDQMLADKKYYEKGLDRLRTINPKLAFFEEQQLLSGYTKGLFTVLKMETSGFMHSLEIETNDVLNKKIEKKQNKFPHFLIGLNGIPAKIKQVGKTILVTIEKKFLLEKDHKVSISLPSNNSGKFLLEPHPIGTAELITHKIAEGHQHTLQLEFKADKSCLAAFEKQKWLGLNGSGFSIQTYTVQEHINFTVHAGSETRAKSIFNQDLKAGQKVNLTRGFFSTSKISFDFQQILEKLLSDDTIQKVTKECAELGLSNIRLFVTNEFEDKDTIHFLGAGGAIGLNLYQIRNSEKKLSDILKSPVVIRTESMLHSLVKDEVLNNVSSYNSENKPDITHFFKQQILPRMTEEVFSEQEESSHVSITVLSNFSPKAEK